MRAESGIPEHQIRPYQRSDAASWLRCRLLSFFSTNYYDDVAVERPRYAAPAIQRVAVVDEAVVGLIDVAVAGAKATIEVLAVHPEHARRGLGTALLHSVLTELRDAGAVETLDVWTREDVPANRWYLRSGFTEAFSYLHVYKSHEDDAAGFQSPAGLDPPLTAFVHAPREREAELRRRFRRVYVCRRYVRALRGGAATCDTP
ncbi:GNAT family N-acetyltransferase [Actinopolymorpha pittospori]|uniref:Ribosomal protein S18 acetylase RimI-like enzyme n=1 Tax=Actinopolymorpha pittospori TaxID=648752 RepID=A0A927MZW8_9ACTN|nr:N-acetyltransferase [Actinopolymorpha pittospori]MBE1609671.1 ribosomal protein S18 acetylase RimI-like enzyme [Actinopolymorpha pittospori]